MPIPAIHTLEREAAPTDTLTVHDLDALRPLVGNLSDTTLSPTLEGTADWYDQVGKVCLYFGLTSLGTNVLSTRSHLIDPHKLPYGDTEAGIFHRPLIHPASELVTAAAAANGIEPIDLLPGISDMVEPHPIYSNYSLAAIGAGICKVAAGIRRTLNDTRSTNLTETEATYMMSRVSGAQAIALVFHKGHEQNLLPDVDVVYQQGPEQQAFHLSGSAWLNDDTPNSFNYEVKVRTHRVHSTYLNGLWVPAPIWQTHYNRLFDNAQNIANMSNHLDALTQ